MRKWLTTASDGLPPPCVVQQYKVQRSKNVPSPNIHIIIIILQKLLSSKTTALSAKLEVYSSLSEEVITLEPSCLSEFEELFQSALKKPQVGTVGEAILSAATLHKSRKHLSECLKASHHPAVSLRRRAAVVSPPLCRWPLGRSQFLHQQ